jgi:lysophospholipase L1-like esterase
MGHRTNTMGGQIEMKRTKASNQRKESSTMATLGPSGSTDKLSLTERCMQVYNSPTYFRVLGLLVLSVFLWSMQQEDGLTQRKQGDGSEDDGLHHFFTKRKRMGSSSSHPMERCFDSDDPEEWKEFIEPGKCECEDPLFATRRYKDPIWDAQHKRLVQDAAFAAARNEKDDKKNKRKQKPEIVWIGDSIVERWNGTKTMGSNPAPEFRTVFETYFDSPSAPFKGLALGSSGDTCTELMWHLENGMLPDELRPDAWIIMIGTNDLGRWDCSKRSTLAGILHVAQMLHTKRPKTPIIIHGLLPRSDVFRAKPETDYTLGRRWDQILWINRELKRFCALHDEWYYIDASKLFLRKVQAGGEDAEGALEILPETMDDALHPSVEGYRQWGERVVRKVEKLLQVDPKQ